MAGGEVQVEPAVLRWARESAAVTLEWAAAKIERPVEVLESWEDGGAAPTLGALRQLTELYKRPLSVFLLPKPPQELPPPVDFRVAAEGARLSRPSRLALRQAARLQLFAVELFDTLGVGVALQVGSRSIAEDPENVAEAERARLGVDLHEQFSWPDEGAALRGWRRAIEDLNVLVFQLSMPWEEVRGFSLSSQELPPAIAINGADYVRPRIFTLFHELGHLVLGTGGICIPEGTLRLVRQHRDSEAFCNDFAGSLLVPAAALTDDPTAAELASWGTPPPDRLFAPLVDRFHVSRQVIWQRLYRTGRLDEQVYRDKWGDWQFPPPKRKTTGGPSAAALSVLRNGARLVSLAFEGCERGAVSRSELLDYLGFRQQQWDKVGAIAAESASGFP
jgi:Zn-dependent peptidase ImmA (M78 family)